MTTIVRKPPPPIRPSMMLAVLLELCVLAAFIHARSWIGIGLCVAYFWFSATWAAFLGRPE